MLTGFPTLLKKEILRFWKVGFQTIFAPVITALLYQLITVAVPVLQSMVFPQLAAQSASRTLVAVFAHADDEGAAAPILARYAREGAHVYGPKPRHPLSLADTRAAAAFRELAERVWGEVDGRAAFTYLGVRYVRSSP